MSEQAMRFRMGLFVLLSLVLLGTLVVLFSAVPSIFKGGKIYTIIFHDAPGVTEGMPVRRSGVRIGEVRSLRLDEQTGTVRVLIAINPPYRIRHNDVPTLITGLFGTDTSIDFIPRTQPEGEPPLDRSVVRENEVLEGTVGPSVASLLTKAGEVVPTTQEALNDMRKSLQRIEKMAPLVEDTVKEYRELAKSVRETVPELRKTNNEVQELAKSVREAVPEARKTMTAVREALPEARKTMEDVGAASRSFTKLSERLDVLVQANQEKVVKAIDNFNEILQRTASLLNDENQRAINATIRNAGKASERLGDIALQTETAIKEATEMIKEGNEAVKDGRRIMRRSEPMLDRVDDILKNLQEATKPLAERSGRILKNIEETTERANSTLGDVRDLFKVLDSSDGTLRKILNDPSLYNNLDAIACQLSRSMPRIDRILKDFETFADKLARHPEALGIGGVVRPGSGLKDAPTPPGSYRQH